MLLDEQNNEQSQQFYALVKLHESARIIGQSIKELPVLRKRLEKNIENKSKARDVYGDLQNQHRRLLDALNTGALSLLEVEHDELASSFVKLIQSIKSFNLMTPDYSKLCEVLGDYLSELPLPNLPEMLLSNPFELPLPDLSDAGAVFDTADSTSYNAESDNDGGNDSEVQTTNNRIIGRLMNNVRMGYYPTCPDNLAHIVRGIESPEGVTINLLDPCCGCGLALRSLAEGVLAYGTDNGIETNCKTYGIELDSYRAEEALTRIDRVGFGSYFHSRISNEAFHAMLLNPPYLSIMKEGGFNTRSEKNFLVHSISNLMIGGLLIYIIPYYRLTADIARVLCDNFNNISVWKFTGSEFKKFKQIAIFGIRQKKHDGSKMAPELSSLALEPENLQELTNLPAGVYQLPAIAKEVSLFKGAIFNKNELAEQLSKSNSFSRLFDKNKLDIATKRPLLPLSIAQIGLVGGSGLINGLVECDTPHIIKGRIVKEKRSFIEDNTNDKGDSMSTTLTETISNKLIFNVLTPNGFISLTDYENIGAAEYSDNDSDDGFGDDDSFDDGADGFDNDGADGFNEGDGNFVDEVNETSGKNGGVGDDTRKSIILPMGRVVITRGAREVLADYEIYNALRRHQSGDWGQVTKCDWTTNNNAVKHGERILSSYLSSADEVFWIITEWDRSATTVLLPEEY